MSSRKRGIALIPARGGSKTIPDKNIKPFMGKPLLAWTVEVAQQTKAIQRIIVSTDDDRIAAVAQQFGAEVMKRPQYLAADDSKPIDVVLDVISRLRDQGEDAPYMMYLEPTSPLRISSDISKCCTLLTDPNNAYRSVATYTQAELHPHRAWKIKNHVPEVFIPKVNPWLPRQMLPKAYQLNGTVYGFVIDTILQGARTLLPQPSAAVIMPKERSIDIDDEVDFTLAELLLQRRMQHEDR